MQERWMVQGEKNHFTCLEYVDYSGPVYQVLFVGGKHFPSCPSSSISLHMLALLIILMQMNRCLPEQLFPVTGLPLKRTAVTLTAYYAVTLAPGHSFSV